MKITFFIIPLFLDDQVLMIAKFTGKFSFEMHHYLKSGIVNWPYLYTWIFSPRWDCWTLWGLWYTLTRADGSVDYWDREDVLLRKAYYIHKEGCYVWKRPTGYPFLPPTPFLIENHCTWLRRRTNPSGALV